MGFTFGGDVCLFSMNGDDVICITDYIKSSGQKVCHLFRLQP